MISRQIGATLSPRSGPGLARLSPSITCASRSGRKTTEPSAFFSSPTRNASAARSFSSASSFRSMASICARSGCSEAAAASEGAVMSGVRERLGNGPRVALLLARLRGGGAGGRGPGRAGARIGNAHRRAQALPQRLQLRVEQRRRFGRQLLREGALHLGPDLLQLLVGG